MEEMFKIAAMLGMAAGIGYVVLVLMVISMTFITLIRDLWRGDKCTKQ